MENLAKIWVESEEFKKIYKGEKEVLAKWLKNYMENFLKYLKQKEQIEFIMIGFQRIWNPIYNGDDFVEFVDDVNAWDYFYEEELNI